MTDKTASQSTKRTDFVEDRIDVIKNIYYLYSCAKNAETARQNWAKKRLKLGNHYMAERFGDLWLFGPSRFVGYINNTFTLYNKNQGNGITTDDVLLRGKKPSQGKKENKDNMPLYPEQVDGALLNKFSEFSTTYRLKKNADAHVPAKLSASNSGYYFVSLFYNKESTKWATFRDHNRLDIDASVERTTPDICKAFDDIPLGSVVCCINDQSQVLGIGIAASTASLIENSIHRIEVAWLCYNPNEKECLSNDELCFQGINGNSKPDESLNWKEMADCVRKYLFEGNSFTMKEEEIYTDYVRLLESNKN